MALTPTAVPVRFNTRRHVCVPLLPPHRAPYPPPSTATPDVSTLRAAGQQWHNRLLTFNGTAEPVIDGMAYHIFPSQDPVQLASGRILAPVTLIADHSTQRWTRNAALMSSDHGATWRLSNTTMLPHVNDAQWEPDFVSVADASNPDAVLMLARNNHQMSNATAAPATSRLLYALSADGGAHWAPLTAVPVETLTSRCMVMRAGRRNVMVLNDFPITGGGLADRRNIALWLRPLNTSLSADDVFAMVPGPSLTMMEPFVAYPQLALSPGGGTLVMVYSQGDELRSIRTLAFDAPPAASPLILPRGNRAVLDARPQRGPYGGATVALVFQSYQYVDFGAAAATAMAMAAEKETPTLGRHFSVAAWMRIDDGPTVAVLDSRSTALPNTQGFVFGSALVNHTYLTPLINLNGPHNVVSTLHLPSGNWAFVAAQVTCSGSNASVTFLVNNLTAPQVAGPGLCAPRNFSVHGARIGGPSDPFASSLGNVTGSVSALTVWPRAVAPADLRAYGNLFASSVGAAPLSNASASAPSAASAAMRLDAADPDALAKDNAWPPTPRDTVSWTNATGGAGATLTVCGRGPLVKPVLPH